MTTTHKSLSSHPRGDVIYRHGRPARFNFSGGYVDLEGTSPRFHYYTLDYLGSVRATVDGTTGALEQTIAYYPFGGIIADLGLNRTLQPYKFLGKELDQTHGLNQYDFGARQYFPALTIFTQPDPLAEKTPWLSPYLYCGANPVNLVDRDGLEFTANSAKYVTSLLNDIDNQQIRIKNEIDKQKIRLLKGNHSEKEKGRIENKISELENTLTELGIVSSEIDILSKSSQIYDITYNSDLSRPSDLSGNGGNIKNKAFYDFKSGYFQILLGSEEIGWVAHELKHAFQFETGDFSTSYSENGEPFYDLNDEIEAYARGALFGVPIPEELDPRYKKLSNKKAVGVSNHPGVNDTQRNTPSMLKFLAKKTKSAFRWNGVTYNGL